MAFNSNTLTPVQQVVYLYVQNREISYRSATCMGAMCSTLEQTSRYARYTLERAALELVEQGVLVMKGQQLSLHSESSDDEPPMCAHVLGECEDCHNEV